MLYPNQTGSVHKEIIRLLSLYHRLKFRQMLLLFPQLSETAVSYTHLTLPTT